MHSIERVMRVMTHINIGAALGLMAWVLWSGWQVVSGQISPARRAAEVQALTRLAAPVQHLPLQAMPGPATGLRQSACHGPQPSPPGSLAEPSGADL